jgi:hypothetical protein
MLLNVYNLLNISIPDLLKTKLETKNVTNSELQTLYANLITEIEKNYILPEKQFTRLKVILAYLVIVEKLQVKK